jgi:purine nucleoside permease
VCSIITGEGEINAATSMMALTLSPHFDLTQTYFLIAGIAGINPACGTTGSVCFSRYVVQVALQYEFDPRDLPSNYTSGYIPQGAVAPGQYPPELYGTEVFELNKDLHDRAIKLASKAKLADTKVAKKFRSRFPETSPASQPPTVFTGATATSDNYFSGAILGDAFANFTKLVTNGTARYCMTAQEDNATLEALLRADLAGLADFSRVIVMRTASDFDRPPPDLSPEQNLFYVNPGGFDSSIANLYRAGIEIVNDIRTNWKSMYKSGIKPSNFIGDILNSLDGPIPPNFGP